MACASGEWNATPAESWSGRIFVYKFIHVSEADDRLFNLLHLRETVHDDKSIVRTVAFTSYGMQSDFHGRWEETWGIQAGCGHTMRIWFNARGSKHQDGSPTSLHQARVEQTATQGVYFGVDDKHWPIKLVRTGMNEYLNGNICRAHHGVKRQRHPDATNGYGSDADGADAADMEFMHFIDF